MFRSGVRRFLSATTALLLLLTLFFAKPQTTSAFFASVMDYNELVAAINDANANGGGVITIALETGLFLRVDLEQTLPTITTDITIIGNDNYLIGGDDLLPSPSDFRAFHIASTGSLSLSNLSLERFLITNGDGGVILNEGELFTSNVAFPSNEIALNNPLRGGIIYNTGYAHIKNSFMGYNIFSGDPHFDNGEELLGTAIYNAGTMLLENVDLSLNIAFTENPNSSATIYNAGQLTFNNVSLWGNAVIELDLADPDPDPEDILTANTVGGLHSIAGSQLTINNSIILLNFIQNCLFDPSATVSVSNSYTIELKDFINLDDIDPDDLPVDPDDLPIDPDDIDLSMIPDTYCAGLTRMQDFDLTLGGAGFLRIIPSADSIDGAGTDALPYDLLGFARNGAPDAGAFEYVLDEYGDPVNYADYPYVYFASSTDTVLEDVGTAQIEIAVEFCDLGCGVPFGGMFDIYILDERTGTATADDDYVAFPHFNMTTVTVDCTAGCPTSVSLPVEIIHDAITPEADETIRLKIIGTSGYGWIDSADQLDFELTIQDAEPTYPTVVDVVDINGVSLDGITYNVSIDELTIQFNMDVFDDGTGANPDSVSNPANYILLREGNVSGFQTASCVGGVSPDDEHISFASVNYNSSNYVTTLTFNPALADADYRLMICGTTSIVSATNPLFHLNNGADVGVNFTIDTTQSPPTPPAPVPAQPSQPEALGVTELPATGERPFWAELLARWLGQ